MSEFTPGPWKIQKPLNIHDVSVCEYEIVGSHETELRGKQQIKICGIHNSVTANANLIAAAPELYRECENAKARLESVLANEEAAKAFNNANLDELLNLEIRMAIETIETALKKARGE